VTAPEEWVVLANGVETAREPGGVRRFAETRPISTYITAIVAGPYHYVSDHYTRRLPDGSTLEIPLGALCRKGLAPYFDTDNVFEVTKQGLDFFHEHFDYPYPFGKYDQAFVPEYNLGAMENPGLVTFREEMIFRGKVTDTAYERRANIILHEMAHMWFGDLVTMTWWDDLWLKESFAEFMGAFVSVEATRFTGAWTSFANGRKAWAYRADQLPSTRPITLGHAHIGVTASMYAHVRLRLQCDVIDLLGNALRNPAQTTTRPDDGDEPPLCAAPVC
jgi:aminopeptidase N